MVNVCQFGAAGDGQRDDTDALQRALDAAARDQETLLFPSGVFLCAELRVPTRVALQGTPAWSYRQPGGTVLRLSRPDARCLLDVSNTEGVTVNGLSLDGGRLGTDVHGVYLNQPRPADPARRTMEDTFRIERCRIDRFSGDGLYLRGAWCFSIRHCMISFNLGHAISLAGCDGFILDNWLSCNHGAGLYGTGWNASVSVNANRIEWNDMAGILLRGGWAYTICGNYIDRSGGPAIAVLSGEGASLSRSKQITMTGNVIYRSGAMQRAGRAALDDCHVRIESADGLVLQGNTLEAGRGGAQKPGRLSPALGIVVRQLQNCCICGNVLHGAAYDSLVVDQGGHGEGVVIKDNPGRLCERTEAADHEPSSWALA